VGQGWAEACCAQGAVTVAASAALGRVVDLAWAPLPVPVGGGSVAVVATEDGCLALVDATQTREQRGRARRLAAFRQLVGGRWPFPQVRPRRARAPARSQDSAAHVRAGGRPRVVHILPHVWARHGMQQQGRGPRAERLASCIWWTVQRLWTAAQRRACCGGTRGDAQVLGLGRRAQAGLAPSPPVGSSLLLPRPWAALLRLLLQAGVPSDALRALAGPPCGRDAALEAVVWAALPRGARDAWDAHPRRLRTTEDEVGHAPALKFPVSACRDGTVHLQHGT